LHKQAARGPEQALRPAEGGDHQGDVGRTAHGVGPTAASEPTTGGGGRAAATSSASA
jgi:hypothetical protein